MGEPDRFDALVGYLVTTARAHHAATGGPNPQWALWYSERLVDDLNRELGVELTVDHLADWLTEADRRYRSDDQERSWPKMYASWLLDEYG